mmetsp:Transcript_15092/g.34239  ORF Transcript_15092/g.34239 Transcript_15092/m.34239 type:complete len:229 (+) Transcript_15092:704-1390(+)
MGYCLVHSGFPHKPGGDLLHITSTQGDPGARIFSAELAAPGAKGGRWQSGDRETSDGLGDHRGVSLTKAAAAAVQGSRGEGYECALPGHLVLVPDHRHCGCHRLAHAPLASRLCLLGFCDPYCLCQLQWMENGHAHRRLRLRGLQEGGPLRECRLPCPLQSGDEGEAVAGPWAFLGGCGALRRVAELQGGHGGVAPRYHECGQVQDSKVPNLFGSRDGSSRERFQREG